MPNKEQIIELMEPLIAEAERTGKWLFYQYQWLWFSPQELRKNQATGHFCWAPANWRIRDPLERLAELKENVERAARCFDEFERRLHGD